MRNGVFSLLLFVLASCDVSINTKKKTSKDMTYSYSCIDSAISGSETNRAISKTTSVIRNLAVREKDITDAMQNEYGDAFHKDALETKTFVLKNDTAIISQLQKALNDLLAVREAPSSINYSVYLIDDKAINAFTFGGHIYLTTAMYDKCKSNPALLYSIIGHEIGHSERGHIKKTIQEMMLSDKILGKENGDLFIFARNLLAGSFNQKNELEADYYGTDLTYRLDQDVCSAVTFWKEMAKEENTYSKLEDFFRTHPFSSLRANCLQQHIQQNFGKSCSVN